MSLHEIGVELQAQLRTQGVPLPVVDGPEPTKTATWGRERIVIEFDPDGTDSFALPRSLPPNARHRYTAGEACKLTIYAQSARSGALVSEHRQRAKAIRNQVLVAMDHVAARRKNRWKPNAGGLTSPADLEKSEKPNGAVYELRFVFELPAKVLTFAGEASPEAGDFAVSNVNNVSLAHGPDDDPNTTTACGA
jgi:hypothetical protein